MTRFAPAITLGLVLLGTACASAQTPRDRTFRRLTDGLRQAEAAETRELRIQWTTAPAAPGVDSAQPTQTFTLVQQRRSPGGSRRERNPEISVNHLVVVVEDANGRELDWRVMLNPRIIRAEVPGPDGQLTGRVVEQNPVELLVTIPDVPAADRIQIYRPVWTGKEYTLEPLARVSIGTGR